MKSFVIYRFKGCNTRTGNSSTRFPSIKKHMSTTSVRTYLPIPRTSHQRWEISCQTFGEQAYPSTNRTMLLPMSMSTSMYVAMNDITCKKKFSRTYPGRWKLCLIPSKPCPLSRACTNGTLDDPRSLTHGVLRSERKCKNAWYYQGDSWDELRRISNDRCHVWSEQAGNRSSICNRKNRLAPVGDYRIHRGREDIIIYYREMANTRTCILTANTKEVFDPHFVPWQKCQLFLKKGNGTNQQPIGIADMSLQALNKRHPCVYNQQTSQRQTTLQGAVPPALSSHRAGNSNHGLESHLHPGSTSSLSILFLLRMAISPVIIIWSRMANQPRPLWERTFPREPSCTEFLPWESHKLKAHPDDGA